MFVALRLNARYLRHDLGDNALCARAFTRPLLVVVPKPGRTPTREDILAFMEGRIAKWWLPDDVVFVKDIPHTATGKIQKITLREQFRDYRLPGA